MKTLRHLSFCSCAGAALLLSNPAPAQVGNLTGMLKSPTNLVLAWQGSYPPYLVQTSSNLSEWCDQGGLVDGTNSALASMQSSAFYRVRHLNSTNHLGPFFGLLQTMQGEFGQILGRHRLKSRIWLYKSKGPPHTSGSYTPFDYWRKLLVNYQYHEDGSVRTWAGALEDLGAVATPGGAKRMTVAWSKGTGATSRAFVLTMDFPYDVNVSRTAAPRASDPTYELKCTYGTAQPEPDFYALTNRTTFVDTINLAEIYPGDPDDPGQSWLVKKYSVTNNGVCVNLHFFEGLPLFQGSPPMIFKTYLLDRWMSPSTGGGGSLPAFSTDSYFSRTHLPGHHNFVESVVIEPGLDPALAEAARSALRSGNIRYIYIFKDVMIGMNADAILYIGFDNTIRNP